MAEAGADDVMGEVLGRRMATQMADCFPLAD